MGKIIRNFDRWHLPAESKLTTTVPRPVEILLTHYPRRGV